MNAESHHLATGHSSREASRCEFCNTTLAGNHTHAIDTATRTVLCVCRLCYLRFMYGGAANGRFRSIPDRYFPLHDDAIGGEVWKALGIPGEVAFFVRHAPERITAFYPAPEGIVESVPPVDVWDAMVRAEPLMLILQPDVEAIFARGRESWVVPIDTCYRLFSRLCARWTGRDGGEPVRTAIDAFVAAIRARGSAAAPAVAGV